MNNLTPMDAVAALYSRDDPKLSAAILASLSRAIFDRNSIAPAGTLKRALARVSHRVLAWTTKATEATDENGAPVIKFSNALLERSGHPYAQTLLTSSGGDLAALVEGGDPMNGPYMMIAPEIRKNSGLWDRLFFDSVQGRDVQSRIIWETRATYQAARQRLEQGRSVRLKAIAAGTGLSMVLVYDRLIREGFNPERITALITDREESNISKARNLLDTLASTRDAKLGFEWGTGITAAVEDVFASDPAGQGHFDIVTAIGILEYFKGCTYLTTEERLKLAHEAEHVTAHDLAERLKDMTTEGSHLVVNTYRDHVSTRILELFGKRFDYRGIDEVRRLLAAVNFRPALVAGSGHIYDVKVYEKHP